MIVIPARHGSTRYPGKPLAEIRGATGISRSLIERSWNAACAVPGISSVAVATDSSEIRDAARAFGAEVIMTSSQCANGTERCAEAISGLTEVPDIVVNLQGDAPLTPAWFVTALIEHLVANPDTQVATPALRCTAVQYDKLVEDEKRGIVGGTSVVFTSTGRAHYFTKRLIPHFDRAAADPERLPAFLHLGVYAYRPEALRTYIDTPPSVLEELEGLEQLRFLDANIGVDVVEIQSPEWEIWELNNPSDMPHIEAALRVMGIP